MITTTSMRRIGPALNKQQREGKVLVTTWWHGNSYVVLRARKQGDFLQVMLLNQRWIDVKSVDIVDEGTLP